MKKGTFSLFISFVIGLGYLLYFFNSHHFIFVTEPSRIFQFTVTLPKLLIPADIIMVILAVFVNLCALIAGSSSLAAGAAVFYGVSVGFQPAAYPYVLIEFLLCVLAAARMRDAGGRNRAKENQDPETVVKYTRSGQNADSGVQSRKASQSASQNQVVYHYTENQNLSNPSQSMEDLRKKFDRYDRSGDGPLKHLFFGILVAVVVLIIVSVFLKSESSPVRNRLETFAQKWDISIPGGDSSDNRGSGGTIGSGSSSTGSSGSSTGTSGSNSTGNSGSNSTIDNGSGKTENSDSGSSGKTDNSDDGKAKVPDLTGYWMMNQNAPGAMTNMRAVIDEDTISMFWIMENGPDMVYWAGSFEPPETADSPYTWVSVRNPDKISAFSSNDETKTFTYNYVDGGSGDTISFAMSSGTSIRFKLHRMGSDSFDGKPLSS